MIIVDNLTNRVICSGEITVNAKHIVCNGNKHSKPASYTEYDVDAPVDFVAYTYDGIEFTKLQSVIDAETAANNKTDIDKRQLFKQMKALNKWGQLKSALQTDQDLQDYFDCAFFFNIDEPEVIAMATSLSIDLQQFFNDASEL